MSELKKWSLETEYQDILSNLPAGLDKDSLMFNLDQFVRIQESSSKVTQFEQSINLLTKIGNKMGKKEFNTLLLEDTKYFARTVEEITYLEINDLLFFGRFIDFLEQYIKPTSIEQELVFFQKFETLTEKLVIKNILDELLEEKYLTYLMNLMKNDNLLVKLYDKGDKSTSFLVRSFEKLLKNIDFKKIDDLSNKHYYLKAIEPFFEMNIKDNISQIKEIQTACGNFFLIIFQFIFSLIGKTYKQKYLIGIIKVSKRYYINKENQITIPKLFFQYLKLGESIIKNSEMLLLSDSWYWENIVKSFLEIIKTVGLDNFKINQEILKFSSFYILNFYNNSHADEHFYNFGVVLNQLEKLSDKTIIDHLNHFVYLSRGSIFRNNLKLDKYYDKLTNIIKNDIEYQNMLTIDQTEVLLEFFNFYFAIYSHHHQEEKIKEYVIKILFDLIGEINIKETSNETFDDNNLIEFCVIDKARDNGARTAKQLKILKIGKNYFDKFLRHFNIDIETCIKNILTNFQSKHDLNILTFFFAVYFNESEIFTTFDDLYLEADKIYPNLFEKMLTDPQDDLIELLMLFNKYYKIDYEISSDQWEQLKSLDDDLRIFQIIINNKILFKRLLEDGIISEICDDWNEYSLKKLSDILKISNDKEIIKINKVILNQEILTKRLIPELENTTQENLNHLIIILNNFLRTNSLAEIFLNEKVFDHLLDEKIYKKLDNLNDFFEIFLKFLNFNPDVYPKSSITKLGNCGIISFSQSDCWYKTMTRQIKPQDVLVNGLPLNEARKNYLLTTNFLRMLTYFFNITNLYKFAEDSYSPFDKTFDMKFMANFHNNIDQSYYNYLLPLFCVFFQNQGFLEQIDYPEQKRFFIEILKFAETPQSFSSVWDEKGSFRNLQSLATLTIYTFLLSYENNFTQTYLSKTRSGFNNINSLRRYITHLSWDRSSTVMIKRKEYDFKKLRGKFFIELFPVNVLKKFELMDCYGFEEVAYERVTVSKKWNRSGSNGNKKLSSNNNHNNLTTTTNNIVYPFIFDYVNYTYNDYIGSCDTHHDNGNSGGYSGNSSYGGSTSYSSDNYSSGGTDSGGGGNDSGGGY